MKTTFGEITSYRKKLRLKKELENTNLAKILDELSDDSFPILIDGKYEIYKSKM